MSKNIALEENKEKFTKHQEKVLWKDTLKGKLVSAYQSVIDECNNLSDTEEIQSAFDNYQSLLDENYRFIHSSEKLKPLLLHFFVSGMENVKCDNCGYNPNRKSFDQILLDNQKFINEFFNS